MTARTKDTLYTILSVSILSVFLTIVLFTFFNSEDSNKIDYNQLKDKIKNELREEQKVNKQFSIDSLVTELKKYNVRFIDIALSIVYCETGYGQGYCNDLLCNANNLFAMKPSYVRPNVSDGIYRIGSSKYVYYSSWRRSVLDFALYQSHWINKNTSRSSWLSFLEKKYSKTVGYSRLLEKIIKTRGLLKYQ